MTEHTLSADCPCDPEVVPVPAGATDYEAERRKWQTATETDYPNLIRDRTIAWAWDPQRLARAMYDQTRQEILDGAKDPDPIPGWDMASAEDRALWTWRGQQVARSLIRDADIAVPEPSEPTAAQQERAKWRANERADRAEAALAQLAAEIAKDWNGRIVTGDNLRAAIDEASPLTDPRISEIEWDEVAAALRTLTAVPDSRETPEPYCPCGGTCHHRESPCSLSCIAGEARRAAPEPPSCVHPGCGLPDRLHGSPDRSRPTHASHYFKPPFPGEAA